MFSHFRQWVSGQHMGDTVSSAYIIFCFLGHGSASILLIILNKSIAIHFPYAFTLVAIQNLGTIVGTIIVWSAGLTSLKPLAREYLPRVLLNAVWLILVLFSSIKSLGLISVPLYVVGRNTVPFQTAFLDWFILDKQMSKQSLLGLFLTFLGTLIYTYADFTIEIEGLGFAIMNTMLVASICVFESCMMQLVKQIYSPVELNFYRVVYGMPMLMPLIAWEWQAANVGPIDIWRSMQPVLFYIVISSVFAWSIGSFLFALQSVVSATTIQLVNIGYKFLTTGISRFTHPAPVHAIGWLGYLICSLGILQYIFKPIENKKRIKNDGANPVDSSDSKVSSSESSPKSASASNDVRNYRTNNNRINNTGGTIFTTANDPPSPQGSPKNAEERSNFASSVNRKLGGNQGGQRSYKGKRMKQTNPYINEVLPDSRTSTDTGRSE